MSRQNCAVTGCSREAIARGWCKSHWQKWKRNGDPLVTKIATAEMHDLSRLLRSVRKEESCWTWTGASTTGGYGQLKVRSQRLLAHRFSYVIHHGAIPEGMEIDHTCSNPKCVNPDHLEPVTAKENTQRTIDRGRNPKVEQTHCVNGHAFDAENTYVKPNGRRACKSCARARTKAWESRVAA